MLIECATRRAEIDHLPALFHKSLRWQKLLRLAEDHGMVPLLAEHTKNSDLSFIPPEVRAALHESRCSQAVLALRLTAELFRLLPRFAKAGIEIMVTKGPALSVRCYGEPGQRQYGDIDLVVRDKDIQRSTEAMIALGYQPKVSLTAIRASRFPGEYAFRKNDTQLLIEFHTERTFRYHPRPLDIEQLFDRRASVVIDGRNVPVLSVEDELVLICIHGAKHFWERLMWIADVAALIARQTLDWDRAMAIAAEVGADRILLLGLRLASDVLGAELPGQLESAVRSDRAVAKLAAQIESRLASGKPRAIGILERAAFRVRMRASILGGAAYLLRLSLSPTEEDWSPGKEGNRQVFVEALRRPFRLVRKHSRPNK
jgi:hypothetical protein